VYIIAKGAAINKAITVAEIAKQKCSKITDQKTCIDEITLADRWEPIDPSLGLDPLIVYRHIPTINITLLLSKEAAESITTLPEKKARRKPKPRPA